MAEETVTPEPAAEPITQGTLNVPPPAATSVEAAALKIDGLLGTGAEPQGDPQPEPVDDDSEPVTVESGEPVEADKAPSDEAETDDDTVELPGTLDGLAEALDIAPEEFGEILVKTKVNGVEAEVPLAEAVKGYQRMEDYSRQTMELGDKRRQFEAEIGQATEQLKQRFSHVETLAKQLEQEVQGAEVNLQTFLDNGDYPGWIQAKQKLESQQKLLQETRAQTEAQQRQQAAIAQKQMADFVQASREQMLAKHPELGDEKRGPEIMKNMTSYLKDHGFTDEDIHGNGADNPGIVDARIVDVVMDAMRFATLNKTKPEEKLLKAKGKKVLKPGATRPKAEGLKEKLAATRRQQRATGSIEDTADVLKQMGFN